MVIYCHADFFANPYGQLHRFVKTPICSFAIFVGCPLGSANYHCRDKKLLCNLLTERPFCKTKLQRDRKPPVYWSSSDFSNSNQQHWRESCGEWFGRIKAFSVDPNPQLTCDRGGRGLQSQSGSLSLGEKGDFFGSNIADGFYVSFISFKQANPQIAKEKSLVAVVFNIVI